MYLHIGSDVLVKTNEVVGVFNLDTGTDLYASRIFLNTAEKKGEIIPIGLDIPKSFVVCKNKNGQKIYLSPLAASTIKKRSKLPLK